MAEPSPTQLRRLFEIAAEAPPERRAAVLAEACKGDAELIRRVEAILAASQDKRFLGKSDFEVTISPKVGRPRTKRSGKVGPANCDVHRVPRS